MNVNHKNSNKIRIQNKKGRRRIRSQLEDHKKVHVDDGDILETEDHEEMEVMASGRD